MGIATPHMGIATPVGIATPLGGIATPTGMATPTGISSAVAGGIRSVEAEGALTADMIRQQLKQHEEKNEKAKAAAHQRDAKKKDGKKKKTNYKF